VLGALEDAGIEIGTFFDPNTLEDDLDQYEVGLRLDENELDEALREQPDLLYRVSQVLAIQISRRDAAKSFLATEDAEVDNKLRQTAAQAQERTTDKKIEALKRTHPRVVAATHQLLLLDHSVRQWTAMKEAVVQRGHALRELVALYVHNYMGSSGSVEVREMRDQRADFVRNTPKDISFRKKPAGNAARRSK
jgi:hypothetical protein